MEKYTDENINILPEELRELVRNAKQASDDLAEDMKEIDDMLPRLKRSIDRLVEGYDRNKRTLGEASGTGPSSPLQTLPSSSTVDFSQQTPSYPIVVDPGLTSQDHMTIASQDNTVAASQAPEGSKGRRQRNSEPVTEVYHGTAGLKVPKGCSLHILTNGEIDTENAEIRSFDELPTSAKNWVLKSIEVHMDDTVQKKNTQLKRFLNGYGENDCLMRYMSHKGEHSVFDQGVSIACKFCRGNARACFVRRRVETDPKLRLVLLPRPASQRHDEDHNEVDWQHGQFWVARPYKA
jgi:hypothetical protein